MAEVYDSFCCPTIIAFAILISNYRKYILGQSALNAYSCFSELVQTGVHGLLFRANKQGMGCEGVCAHTHVRCAVPLETFFDRELWAVYYVL